MFWYIGLAICLVVFVVALYSADRYMDDLGLAIALVSGIAGCVFLVCSCFYMVGDRGNGERTGVITSVTETGIFWKTKYMTIVTANADGTFASNGAEYEYAVLDDVTYEIAKELRKEHKVVTVHYNIKSDNPWVSAMDNRVSKIE